MEVPESKDISPITEIPFAPKMDEDNIMTRRASEKVKRKMKMADLKAFVELKLLSKSEKALEKIGQEDHKFSFHTAVRMISVDIFFLANHFCSYLTSRYHPNRKMLVGIPPKSR